MRRSGLVLLAAIATCHAAATDAFAGLGADGTNWGNMTFFLPTIDARLAALGRAMHFNSTQQSSQRRSGASGMSSSMYSSSAYSSFDTTAMMSSSMSMQQSSSMRSSSSSGQNSQNSQSAMDLSACYPIYAEIAAPFPSTSSFLQGAQGSKSSKSMLARCIRPLAKYHVVQGRWSGLLYPANDTLVVLPTLLKKQKSGNQPSQSSTASMAPSSTVVQSTVVQSTVAQSSTNVGIGGSGESFSNSSGIMAAIFRAFALTASPTTSESTMTVTSSATSSSMPTATLEDSMVIVVNATSEGTVVHGGGNSKANVVGGYSFIWGQIYIIDAVLVPPMPLNDTLGAMGFEPNVNATGWDDPSADITAVYSESGRNATVSSDGAFYVNGTAGQHSISGTDGSQHTIDSPDGFNATFDGTDIVEADVPLSNGVLHVVE